MFGSFSKHLSLKYHYHKTLKLAFLVFYIYWSTCVLQSKSIIYTNTNCLTLTLSTSLELSAPTLVLLEARFPRNPTLTVFRALSWFFSYFSSDLLQVGWEFEAPLSTLLLHADEIFRQRKRPRHSVLFFVTPRERALSLFYQHQPPDLSQPGTRKL